MQNTTGRLTGSAYLTIGGNRDETLENQTLSGSETHRALGTLSAQNNLTVASGSDVTFKGGNIILGDGFTAADGAEFRAEIDPDYVGLNQSCQACLEHSRKVTLFSYDNNGRVATKYILTKEKDSQLATRLDYTNDRPVLSGVEGQDNLTQLDLSHEGETYH